MTGNKKSTLRRGFFIGINFVTNTKHFQLNPLAAL